MSTPATDAHGRRSVEFSPVPDRAAKRGGGQAHVPLGPSSDDDSHCLPQPASDETPETVYERRWALTVLDAAIARLKHDCAEAGDGVLFETLADMVDDPADVDAELAYLLDVLGRRHRASSLKQP